MATFGLLALLGEATHGAGARLAYLIAAGIAVAAAVAEARGMRIVPQIRRQLPEGWRWTMPLPLAAGLYGILLGLGFTTFVLSFGVWALAGISVALGDPTAGVIIGAAFGVGRAIPVVAVAPAVDTRVREQVHRADGGAAVDLPRSSGSATRSPWAWSRSRSTSTASATAARTEVPHGADPSAAGKALAFQRADRAAFLRFGGHTYNLPGRDPAVGGPYVAVISGGNQVNVLNRFTRQPVASVKAPGAQAIAISREWLAYLAIRRGRYLLRARRITNPANPGDLKGIASVPSPSPTRPSEPRWQQRLLHGVEAAPELDQAPQPQVRQGWHGASLPHRPAAQSLGAGQAPALRSREPRLGAAAGDPSAASEPDADDQATEPPRTGPQDLSDAGDGELSGRRRWRGGTRWSPCSGTVARRSSRPTGSGYRGGARTCGGMFPTPIAR